MGTSQLLHGYQERLAQAENVRSNLVQPVVGQIHDYVYGTRSQEWRTQQMQTAAERHEVMGRHAAAMERLSGTIENLSPVQFQQQPDPYEAPAETS